MTFEELRDKAHSLPLKPGVYIMQNAASEVIYVGKAKALKNRVSQYFQDQSRHNEKTRAMVSQIDHFDVIVVQSEFEALVLECSLIKRHQPRYNILLKDGKGYPYIRVSAERYPQFSLASKAADDGARYFGPYGSRGASQGIIDALREALRLPACRRKFPRDIGKERPCLNFHMGVCDGYCRSEMDQSQYQRSIDQAIRLLEGRLDEVVDELSAEMELAAEELRFEKAAQIRDRIRSIQLLSKRQKAVAGSLADTDVVGWHRGEAKSCFVVLHYIDGELAAKNWELLANPMEDDNVTISALAAQYYSGRGQLPKQILLPCDIDERVELARMLTEAVGRKVEVLTPQRGAKMDLVKLANENAAEEVLRATTAEERRSKLTEALGTLLGLDGPPHRVEAFDISNTGSSDIVASMTVHIDGRPLKRDYRHFKLNDMPHADDYASIRQVVERRFRRYLDGDEKFAQKPDLLLMDGGAGQVKMAEEVLSELGLGDIPVFGMVKDNRHRTRALVASDGRETGIQQNQALFAMVGRIQEETHRFAIEFHRQQQAGHLKGSALDGIPKVGPARKAALLKHFKSIKAIRAASLEELQNVVPKDTAQAVYTHFQEQLSKRPGKDEGA